MLSTVSDKKQVYENRRCNSKAWDEQSKTSFEDIERIRTAFHARPISPFVLQDTLVNSSQISAQKLEAL